jgi:hypothetical protein
VTCRTCGRAYVSDNTPLAREGYCLFCRAGVPTTCVVCGADCEGKPDGQRWCQRCRDVPLGLLLQMFEAGTPW